MRPPCHVKLDRKSSEAASGCGIEPLQRAAPLPKPWPGPSSRPALGAARRQLGSCA